MLMKPAEMAKRIRALEEELDAIKDQQLSIEDLQAIQEAQKDLHAKRTLSLQEAEHKLGL